VLLAGRTVEIVADRGLSRQRLHPQWEDVCRQMQSAWHAGRFEEGSIAGIERLGTLLEHLFPAAGTARPGAVRPATAAVNVLQGAARMNGFLRSARRHFAVQRGRPHRGPYPLRRLLRSGGAAAIK
jgi:hypothetical protein